MQKTDLAYLVDETVAQLQRHVRETTSCGTMIKLLEGMNQTAAAHKPQQTPPPSNDPLDGIILALCGDKGAARQPPLKDILEFEIGKYRRRVAKSKKKLQDIIYGNTPERRLQNIVHETVAVARTEKDSPQRPMTTRLAQLVGAIEELGAACPDLIGQSFNLQDARNLACPAMTAKRPDAAQPNPVPPPEDNSRPVCRL